MMRSLFLCVSILLAAAPGWALSQQAGPATASILDKYIGQTPEGGVAWATLNKITETQKIIDRQAIIVPKFTPEVAAMNGQTIKLQGFLLSLEPEGKIKHFLLSALPPSCPYCPPAGPKQLVEVYADTPIDYTYDPVIVEGKFATISDSIDGIYFRMTGARRLER